MTGTLRPPRDLLTRDEPSAAPLCALSRNATRKKFFGLPDRRPRSSRRSVQPLWSANTRAYNSRNRQNSNQFISTARAAADAEVRLEFSARHMYSYIYLYRGHSARELNSPYRQSDFCPPWAVELTARGVETLQASECKSKPDSEDAFQRCDFRGCFGPDLMHRSHNLRQPSRRR